jgi:hypothetical protein
MEGTFRLQRQTSRWARFAQVTVEVIPCDADPDVVIGADVFGWRRALYGPDAWPYPYDDDLRLEAMQGARYALEQVANPRPQVRVVIREILERTADTGPGDVKFAAAHAVWRAINREPADPPWIDQDGTPHFPG